MLFPNNSVVSLSDILDSGLYCVTNSFSCCGAEDGEVAGEWFLPGETLPVFSVGCYDRPADLEFSTLRFGIPSAVLLSYEFRNLTRSEDNFMGIYTCQIPDSSGQLQTVYIGVDIGNV